MLIGGERKETKDVKFVSYDGRWPNLCCGMLTLEIAGHVVTFGENSSQGTKGRYPKFWSSGGACSMSCIDKDQWEIYVERLPEEYRQYAEEIDAVMNGNIEHGCCGGCR